MGAALILSPAVVRELRCEYQQQDCPMTLCEGLEEYYRANRGRVLRPEDLTPESKDLFRSHDMCHVIFGLDTTMSDEAMADTRTLFSCDVGFGTYARYLMTNPDAKAIFKDVGYLRVIWGTLLTTPRLLRAMVASFRMPKKWPWTPTADELRRPLAELRREYGIRVI